MKLNLTQIKEIVEKDNYLVKPKEVEIYTSVNNRIFKELRQIIEARIKELEIEFETYDNIDGPYKLRRHKVYGRIAENKRWLGEEK